MGVPAGVEHRLLSSWVPPLEDASTSTDEDAYLVAVRPGDSMCVALPENHACFDFAGSVPVMGGTDYHLSALDDYVSAYFESFDQYLSGTSEECIDALMLWACSTYIPQTCISADAPKPS